MLAQTHLKQQSKPFSSFFFLLLYLALLLADDLYDYYARNELLRALDLRLTVLKEEIFALLNRAVVSNMSTRDVSDLSSFVQHFGASEFRYGPWALCMQGSRPLFFLLKISVNAKKCYLVGQITILYSSISPLIYNSVIIWKKTDLPDHLEITCFFKTVCYILITEIMYCFF